jgi:hypothetical protein
MNELPLSIKAGTVGASFTVEQSLDPDKWRLRCLDQGIDLTLPKSRLPFLVPGDAPMVFINLVRVGIEGGLEQPSLIVPTTPPLIRSQ